MTGFAFAYAVMHGLWRSATEKSGCATIGDRENDVNGILKERYGLFHCWGEIIRSDSETGRKLQETVAIVEEIGTGEVYKANPNTIVFIKEGNNSE